MELVVILLLAHGLPLALLFVFEKLVRVRGTRSAGRRFRPLAMGTGLWILADASRHLSGTSAGHALSLGLETFGLLFLGGGVYYFYKELPADSPRRLLQKGSFARAGAWTMVFALLSAPSAFGPEVLVRLITPWRPVLVFPAVSAGLAISLGPLINTRTLLPRVWLYLGTITAAGFLVALLLFWFNSAAVDLFHGYFPYAPYILFIFLTILVFAMGRWHIRYLRLSIQFLFYRDVYSKERELGAFLNELQGVTDSRESRESMLEMILQNLYRVYHCEKALILTTDDEGRRVFRQVGTPSARLGIESLEKQFPFLRIRLPEKTARRMDRAFLLETGIPGPFPASADSSQNSTRFGDRSYPRTAARLRESVAKFQEEGYRIFLPLIFHNVVHGVIFLGAREGGLPYFNGEITLLNRVRTLFGMALRNDALLREFQALGRDERNPLKNAQLPEGVQSSLTRIRLQNKTLVYAGSPLREVVEETGRIASLPLPVLIQGETGTGKELFARLLHERGFGEDAPFIAVNCAAIPKDLWESQIFGHRRGAFTGAAQDHPGFVEQAAGGLLFFDEIGEMPLEIQPKILRLIQERTFQAVGARKPSRVECRLVFATHRDLATLSKAGKFREDLYYRINVHRIQLPGLRERRPEIPLLARHLLEAGAKEHNLPAKNFAPATLELLNAYEWPGNIRELENCILACLGQTTTDTIQPDDLPLEIQASHVNKKKAGRKNEGSAARGRQVMIPESSQRIDFEVLMKDYARDLIEYTLKTCRGNRTHAAQMLGITRGKLLYQIKELGIAADES